MKRISILRNNEVIDASVRQYVEAVRAHLEKATDFDTKRHSCSIMSTVVYANDRVALCVRTGGPQVWWKAWRPRRREHDWVSY